MQARIQVEKTELNGEKFPAKSVSASKKPALEVPVYYRMEVAPRLRTKKTLASAK